MVKNLPANAGDVRDAGSISGSGKSLREENGNPLQYSCLETPMDRGTSWATVYRVAKSWTRLKQLSSSSGNTYTTESLCCIPETNSTLQISCISIKKLNRLHLKKKNNKKANERKRCYVKKNPQQVSITNKEKSVYSLFTNTEGKNQNE